MHLGELAGRKPRWEGAVHAETTRCGPLGATAGPGRASPRRRPAHHRHSTPRCPAMRFRRRTSLSVALALLIAACSAGPAEETAPAKPRLGLFSTLPIYWGEGDVAALIDSGAEPDWV